MSTTLTSTPRATLTDLARAEGKAAGDFAYGDNVGFAVPELSIGRESFSPDAVYYTGPPLVDAMRFVPGPPDIDWLMA